MDFHGVDVRTQFKKMRELAPEVYRAFLESPGPRAFALSGDGRCGFAGGLQDAPDVALRQCSAVAKQPCALYAVDQAVVWKPSPAQGVATAQ